MSEAARRGALDPAPAARYNLLPGAWCVPVRVQQVGQYPQKMAHGFLVKFFSPRAGSCLYASHYGPQCQGQTAGKYLDAWEVSGMVGYRPRWAQTPPDPCSHAHPSSHLCLHPVITLLSGTQVKSQQWVYSHFIFFKTKKSMQRPRDRETHWHPQRTQAEPSLPRGVSAVTSPEPCIFSICKPRLLFGGCN